MAVLQIILGILPKDIDHHVSAHGIAAERDHRQQRQSKRKRQAERVPNRAGDSLLLVHWRFLLNPAPERMSEGSACWKSKNPS